MAIKKLPSTGDAPRTNPTRNGLPEGISAGGVADSAGYSWQGRNFAHHDTAFADDEGQAPREFIAVHQALQTVCADFSAAAQTANTKLVSYKLQELAQAQKNLLQTLATIRVLVPMVAEAGQLGRTPEGKIVEKTQELSIVKVQAPDGRAALPVFTSTAAMRAWSAEARPIPVPMPQAIMAAAQEEASIVIVDPGSPTECGIRVNQFQQIAAAKVVQPGWADESTHRELKTITQDLPEIVSAQLLPLDPSMLVRTVEVDLVLSLIPQLNKEQVQQVVQTVSNRWTANQKLTGAIDSLRIRVIAAN